MHENETDILRGNGRFRTTSWSELRRLGAGSGGISSESLARFVGGYWRPIYSYVRVAGRRTVEDAKDLTQSFLARLLELAPWERLDPSVGSFRGYMKTALRNFLRDARRGESAHGRIVSLDGALRHLPELDSADVNGDPDLLFDRAWFRDLLDRSLVAMEEELARSGKDFYWQTFRLYCLEPERAREGKRPTYRDVAETLGILESDVRNYLHHARTLLRWILQERVREYAANDEEIEAELKLATGALPR